MPARKTAKYNSLNKTASGQSARSHQKDLAKISGKTAATSASKKAVEKQKKTSTKKPTLGYGIGLDKMARIEMKATKKTMGSFKKSK